MTPFEELTEWFRGDGAGRLSAAALDEARSQGVHLLVADRAGAASVDRIEGYPALARELQIGAVIEAARAQELRRVVDALAQRGIRTLIFKGAALAYSVYAQPYLRPSSDFDLFIGPDDRGRVVDLLHENGYVSEARITGDLVMPQQCMTLRTGSVTHTLDVHWKLVNPVAYSQRLTFDSIWPTAVGVPRLSRTARMPSLSDHLLISCLHRVAHHQNDARLIWLYDIHLLATHLDTVQKSAAIARAGATHLARECHIGLTMAQEAFGGIDASLIDAFAHAGESESVAAAFLSPDTARISMLREDIRALNGVWPRVRLLREHLLPPASYIRRLYPRIPAAFLPVAYVLRILRGAPKWFNSPV